MSNKKLSSYEIRKIYIDFWTQEPRNFKEAPNVSLVPNVDSSLLFVNSGMFPLAPYLGGQPHPLGKRLCNIQRCLRTNYDEMLEIGDNRHTLMFEMMGDWSIGDFTKKEQIPWWMELYVGKLGLDPKRLYVSIFEGDDDAKRDDEAIEIWKETFKKYGVDAEFCEDITKVPANLEEGESWNYRIFPYNKKKNWWQRAEAVGELGGPTSEVFYDMGKVVQPQDKYHINDDSGRFIELGNNVFMEYSLNSNMQWIPLEQKNIDYGGGFERIVMVLQGKNDIFETDIYEPIIKTIEEISGKSYKEGDEETEYTKYFRILADHSRAAAFILGDGVIPSNKDQGYILRRFIRRLVRYGLQLGITDNFTRQLAQSVVDKMSLAYTHLSENKFTILTEIDKEETKFKQTLKNGLKEIQKMKLRGESLDGKKAFYIYETFGFPFEMSCDEFGIDEDKVDDISNEFENEVQRHRDTSRSGAEHKFRGGLADQSEDTTKLHTAHHILLRALQIVLGNEIKQKGSNITSERLRIDFNYPEKLTDEQKQKVEDIVNDYINKDLKVERFEISKQDAEKIGAQMEFGQKYPDIVSVYVIGLKEDVSVADASSESYFSAEFCGGPHVENTGKLNEGGRKFKIKKEESSGQGVRRIKAVLE